MENRRLRYFKPSVCDRKTVVQAVVNSPDTLFHQHLFAIQYIEPSTQIVLMDAPPLQIVDNGILRHSDVGYASFVTDVVELFPHICRHVGIDATIRNKERSLGIMVFLKDVGVQTVWRHRGPASDGVQVAAIQEGSPVNTL